MYAQYSHLYDRIPLAATGIVMGSILVLLHLAAILWQDKAVATLRQTHLKPQWGALLMCFDFVWIVLLLLKADWNPLCMPLFTFEHVRPYLLFAAPVVCFVMCTKSTEHLFARALGLFILLAAIIPLSAAFLKDPVTRLLIPIWWYPALTVAMFWVAKPYLLRDWAFWLSRHPVIYKFGAWLGLVYGIAVLCCAILFW